MEQDVNNMNYSKIESQAQAMANKAKDGILKHSSGDYILRFSQTEWNYHVIDQEGDTILRINSKSISKAKAFLKEWLEN